WRPHIKTAKLRFVMEMLIKQGIQQFKAATTLELLTLCELGAADVLLAYPVAGRKQKRLEELARQYPRTKISVIVENLECALAWQGLSVGVFVDVNAGMDVPAFPSPRFSMSFAPSVLSLIFGDFITTTDICVSRTLPNVPELHIQATDPL